MKHVEFRTVTLKPGTRDAFHRLMVEESLPLQARWNVDVIFAGPSLHDDHTYCVIRAYDSLEHRQHSQDSFYASDDWRLGPREQLVPKIEFYTDVVFALDEPTIAGLRALYDSSRI